MFGSPPASLQIPASEAFEYMRAAFRIWTMELRPKWIGRRHGCAPDKPGGMSLKEEDCVMLAALNIKVLPTSPPGGFIVAESSTSSVEVDESKRPFLVHLRMLEEWLLCRERQASPANEVVKEREFGRVESGGSSVAYSRADHTHGTPVLPELSGDVGGQIVHAKVTGIQGFPVAETEPAKGQVLTFRVVDGSDIKTGKWLPAELPPPAKPELPKLDGDVTGALDTNKIDKIQGIPINLPKQPRDATVLNGQVLTFRDKGLQLEEVQKQTVNGDFVEHPKGLGQYLIVAAGTIRGDNKNKLSPYNGLVVSKLLPGQMFVTFKGYKPPDETFQYVVKVLPVSNAKVKMPIVSFDGFQRDQGLALKLFDGQEAVSQEILGSLELMIEVSQYFVIR